MFDRRPAGVDSASAPSTDHSRWAGLRTLKLIHDLNERCLKALTDRAQEDRPSEGPGILRLHRDEWHALEGPLHAATVAHFPFLLLDVRFDDDRWWHAISMAESETVRPCPTAGFFPSGIATTLMRETLMLAWHTVQLNRGAAMILLGASAPVCACIASLRLPDIERLSVECHTEIAPRWAHLTEFWRPFLRAVRTGDFEFLYDLHLHGFQLLGRGFTSPTRS
ncbi:MAG: hypothetical protein ACRET4_05885 [Steroidobacteraceae bacterium]